MDNDLREWLCGRLHQPLPRSQTDIDAVFVDRDGTLNAHLPGYRTIQDFALIDGAAKAIAAFNEAGIPVILVTNQRGLATGALTWNQLVDVHNLMMKQLAVFGAHLDDIRLCPHEAGTCLCRKPLPGMLTQTFAENPHLYPARCLMFGDTQADAEAASAANVSFYGVTSGKTLAFRVAELL